MMGETKFLGPKTLQVDLNDGGVRTLAGERIFLNLGTHASIPSTPGLAECGPLTISRRSNWIVCPSTDRHRRRLRRTRIRSGLSPIWKSRYHSCNAPAQLLANSRSGRRPRKCREFYLPKAIDVITSAEILPMSKAVRELEFAWPCKIRVGGSEKTIRASHILVATGRTRIPPASDWKSPVSNSSREVASGERSSRDHRTGRLGHRRMRGQPAIHPRIARRLPRSFATISPAEVEALATADASCLFTDPQVAHVGLTETVAQAHGQSPFKSRRCPCPSVLRAQTIGRNSTDS